MTTNSETLLPDGTALITRVIPVPDTLSPEAQAHLATGETWAPEDGSPGQKEQIERALAMYPVRIEDATLAGVPVRIVQPQHARAGGPDCLLMNLHGGGFVTDSGSMLESIPIAALTGVTVVTVLYRLAPQHIFPAAVDDAAAVYGELLKTHAPHKLVIYGTSAGGILTAQTAVRLRQTGVPLPAALGFFTAFADSSRHGDSAAFFSVSGLAGEPMLRPGEVGHDEVTRSVGGHDPRDPAVSPIYADLRGFPPTLCVAGTRDMMLSGTANFHRALLRAGVDADLIVFDAMPHAHWYMVGIPEAQEANEAMARYFVRALGLAAGPAR
jgi:epsilon-lactone hydrolase